MYRANANVRFIEPQYGPTEVECLYPEKKDHSAFWGFAKSLFNTGVDVAKSTIRWNVGDDSEDNNEIKIYNKGGEE